MHDALSPKDLTTTTRTREGGTTTTATALHAPTGDNYAIRCLGTKEVDDRLGDRNRRNNLGGNRQE